MSRYKNLSGLLIAAKETDKGIIFVEGEDDEKYLSYRDLYNKSISVLSALQSKGLVPGDELIFQIKDNYSFIITFWACILGGIIPVPVPEGKSDEGKTKIIKIWNTLNRPHLVISEKFFESFQGYLSKLSERVIFTEDIMNVDGEGKIYDAKMSDVAMIQFSSGSTGDPKGVILTNENLLTNIKDILNGVCYTPEDTTFSWMPLTHDMGLIGFHMSSMCGMIDQYIMATELFIRKPKVWLDKVSLYEISIIASPNFGYKLLLASLNIGQKPEWDLSNVKILLNGAEPISSILCEKFLEAMSVYGLKQNVITPVYGLAEASLVVTFPMIGENLKVFNLNKNCLSIGEKIKYEDNPDNSVSFVGLGYEVQNCFIRICDENNEVVDDSVIGRIQIKGKNVTQGYYNNLKATQEMITDDQWVKTGDIGFLCDGNLVVIGREKDIIFINGQNYYPYDIEQRISSITNCESAACSVINDVTKSEMISIFVAFKGTIEEFAPLAVKIKKYINKTMELQVVNVMPVDKIPKTDSGKIQRYKLSNNFKNGQYTKTVSTLIDNINKLVKDEKIDLPENEIQEELVEIWRDVLKVDNIGINSNFFELGGNSLKASMLLTKVEEQFKVKIPISKAFEIFTIKELSKYIETTNEETCLDIEKVEKKEYYPLSSAQKRLFILNKLDNSTSYNITAAMEVKGELNKERLELSFKKLLDRHEALRTYFDVVEDEPVQRIAEEVQFKLEFDVCKEDEISKKIESFVQPFNLFQPLLIRAKVLSISKEHNILVFDVHHIIADGISCSIMLKELVKLYEGKELGELKAQYKEFAVWQNKEAMTNKIEQEKRYWIDKYSDEVPVLNFPTDYPRPAVQSFEGDSIGMQLPKENLDKLESLAKKTGTTLFMILLSAYYVLLNKYTGQEDILVGIPVSGRRRAEVNDVVGMFVNTLVLRNMPKSNLRFKDFLQEVKEDFLKAFDNQDLQFEMLVDELKIKRSMDRNAMFDTMFVLQNMDDMELKCNDLEFTRYYFPSTISKFDTTVQVTPRKGGLFIEFEFCTKLFKKSTVERLMKHYVNILNTIVQSPDITIADIDILTTKEKDILLNKYNNTNMDYPKEKTICELFEETVRKFPDTIAVEEGDRKITYEELNRKANIIANKLIEKGVGPNVIVGIAIPRSIELIVGIVAIMKAGGAYLPIDIRMPEPRIKYIIENSKTQIILTKDSFMETVDFDGTVMNLEDSSLNEGNYKNPVKVNDVQDILYTIYTSGSTGNPKGVKVQHQALNNFLHSIKKEYDGDVGNGDKCLSVANVSFDVSVAEIFMPIVFGATLVLYEKASVTDLQLFKKTIIEKEITYAYMPPTILKELYGMLEGENICLNKILTGVEPIADDVLQAFFNLNPDMKIINGYGPTETTICATFYRYRSQKTTGKKVPIGKPLANLQIYLLDKNQNLVPIGALGELCISGDGVTKGYLNNPEMTNEKFIDNPFMPGSKLYKTGDLSRWNSDGNIEFMGRADQQVKISGYRIELGEIENKLLNHVHISKAVVLAKDDVNGNKYLCAYVVSDIELKAEEIKNYLSGELPYYMIPACYVRIESVPVTSNGKIDKRSLPEPVFEAKTTYEAPRNDIEKELVEVWQQVLGVKKVGINDNFFELGGNSLKAIQVGGKVKGFGLTMQHILSNPTIAELAKCAIEFGDSVELSEAMKENMSIDYYFNSEGERDPLTEIMDCGNLMLYFALKKQVNNYGEYSKYLVHGFNMDITIYNNNNKIYDMNCFSEHMRKDVFEITRYSGFGEKAMSHIEELLNEGEQVIIDVFCLRNPAFKEFVSYNVPEQKQRRGHVFMLVAHDEQNLYYVEMPDGINSENYIPYRGNKSVGIISKEKMLHAFEIEVYYATIKINKEKIKKETDVKKLIKEILKNYDKQAYLNADKTTYYGQEALQKFIDISKEESLMLKDKNNRYKRTLQDIVDWKFTLIIWRLRLFRELLIHYEGECNLKEKVIDNLEGLACKWEEVCRIIVQDYEAGQTLDKALSEKFEIIKTNEEELMNQLRIF